MKKVVVGVESHFMSNAFALFGLPIHFDLNVDVLDQQYFAAQATVHPDAFVGRSNLEKRIAAQRAVTLNEAYHRLKNGQTRAQEFLKAKNIPIPGASGATIPASALLMEVLDWRERINTGGNLSSLEKELTQRLTHCVAQFDIVTDDKLPYCYLELTYIQKTLTELTISRQK